jgi:hypothetical protein
MRLGLLADLHEHVEPLRLALDLFARERVDRVVLLGDNFDPMSRRGAAAEVATLLAGADAVGVWGNHDAGLCVDVREATRQRYPAHVLEYTARLLPRLVIEDCLFTHIEPRLDPTRVEDLWGFTQEGRLDSAEKARPSFAARGERFLFMGHHHRWWATTPEAVLPWDGATPLDLSPVPRALVIVGAAYAGRCGVFDTQRAVLTPYSLPVSEALEA